MYQQKKKVIKMNRKQMKDFLAALDALVKEKPSPERRRPTLDINDPHLSGLPAGIGTAAFRGCRTLITGRSLESLLISKELKL